MNPCVKILSNLSEMKLAIPAYQRPYSWKTSQVRQLLDDLHESKRSDKDFPYIMGSIIVFRVGQSDKLEIVDGQQRLTTLSIIIRLLSEGNSQSILPLKEQKYEHSESQKNIKTNVNYISDWLLKEDMNRPESKKEFLDYILDKTTFVIISAPSLDDAFLFFDSQNTRGKPLEKYDLLKAHHLRYVSESSIARDCAVSWEKIDKEKRLNLLVETILARVRAWSRKDYQTDVLEEFKSQRVTRKEGSFYKLSRYHQPPLFDQWRFIDRELHDKDDGLEFIFRDIDAWQGTKRLKFVSESKRFMPFQIGQPLEGGEQFFWFIEKYDKLYCDLFINRSILPPLSHKLYDTLLGLSWNTGVAYIRQVFEGALLFYYDKFGHEELDKFCIFLEHSLYLLRLRQGTVQYRSINKFIINEFNPFAIIAEAAFPEHVIRRFEDYAKGKYSESIVSQSIKGICGHYLWAFYGENGFYTQSLSQVPSEVQDIKKKVLGIYNNGSKQ